MEKKYTDKNALTKFLEKIKEYLNGKIGDIERLLADI